MHRLVVTLQAKLDIDDILARSEARFGAAAADRYRRLIDRALNALRRDPERPSARRDPDLSVALRLYHLRSSATRAPVADRVTRPRHLIAFSFDAQEVRILRVLHDRMDVARQVSGNG